MSTFRKNITKGVSEKIRDLIGEEKDYATLYKMYLDSPGGVNESRILLVARMKESEWRCNMFYSAVLCKAWIIVQEMIRAGEKELIGIVGIDIDFRRFDDSVWVVISKDDVAENGKSE